jgi:polysaccharide biosynthesis protein PslH
MQKSRTIDIMRILLISRCPPYPLHLGDRLIVHHLGYELEARRHTIDLLAFANRPDDWYEKQHYEGIFNRIELIPEPKRSWSEYLLRQVSPLTRFPSQASESWSPAMWKAIEQMRLETRYDAVHLFGGVQVYEYLHALGDLPAIITPYESYSLYLQRAVKNPPPKAKTGARLQTLLQWRLARAFEGWMFAPYQRTVVVSERDREMLHSINPRLNVDVIPNGIDPYYFKPSPLERLPNVMIFTGNYEYAPNVDAALRLANEVLPRVRERIPDVTLWLVGNQPPPELVALARENIKVTGRVPDIRPYLARATVFVSALRLGAGIKNKILEAMAMGCPVVGTSVSMDGINIVDGRDARVVHDDQLANAVTEVLCNSALQQTLSRHGQQLVRDQYTWAKVAQMYEALYNEVANNE